MSLEYAENRIREALKLSHGNATRARQQIIAWAQEDTKLLQALTKPHLSGIVAYNIDRVASGRAAAAKAPQQSKPKAPPQQSIKGDRFGMELLKAVASSSADVFGLEHNVPVGKRGQASQNHINAIRAMAAKKKKPS